MRDSSRDYRDHRDSSRDYRDHRDSSRDYRDHRDSSRDYRDHRDSSRDYRDSSRDYRDSSRDYRDSSRDYRDSSRDYRDSSRDYRDHRDSSRDYRDSSRDYRDSSRDHRDSSRDHRDSSRDHRDSSRDHRDSSRDHRDHQKTNQQFSKPPISKQFKPTPEENFKHWLSTKPFVFTFTSNDTLFELRMRTGYDFFSFFNGFINEISGKYTLHEEFEEQDKEIVLNMFKYHPEYELRVAEKGIPVGVTVLHPDQNKSDGKPEPRNIVKPCFAVRFSDPISMNEVIDDFSYIKVCKEIFNKRDSNKKRIYLPIRTNHSLSRTCLINGISENGHEEISDFISELNRRTSLMFESRKKIREEFMKKVHDIEPKNRDEIQESFIDYEIMSDSSGYIIFKNSFLFYSLIPSILSGLNRYEIIQLDLDRDTDYNRTIVESEILNWKPIYRKKTGNRGMRGRGMRGRGRGNFRGMRGLGMRGRGNFRGMRGRGRGIFRGRGNRGRGRGNFSNNRERYVPGSIDSQRENNKRNYSDTNHRFDSQKDRDEREPGEIREIYVPKKY